MSDRMSVRATELVTHAGHVEAVADGVATAAGAGRAVRAGNDAYGQLCVMVPAMLNALQDILVDGLDECAESCATPAPSCAPPPANTRPPTPSVPGC
ncbi:type VII secretion target [Paractinoplanes atraurantiacus]|uniref:type VII secretion target n=1 Tax=Paractinoplanes atraurantiacus TaxID=1036182 RepID=UPI001FE9210E|nr:type VII secretion target [Actinoplanes atraurantiacus]